MVAPSVFDAVRHGKSKAEVNRKKQSYTQTFTSVLDYPRKAPEPAMPSAEASTSALPAALPPPVTTSQRTQRKAKSNAITRMDYTRERENTVPPSGSSLSSGLEKSATPKASLLPSASSNLTSVSSTNASNSETPIGPHPSNNPILKKAHLEKAPALDRKSVRWSGPRVPKPSTKPRQFGLKECPTFYPTADEFRDPMEYLRKVGEEGRGKEFGMCKIVPPEGWQMPFVLDTEVSCISLSEYR
jgi:histone demethylase JARID1